MEITYFFNYFLPLALEIIGGIVCVCYILLMIFIALSMRARKDKRHDKDS